MANQDDPNLQNDNKLNDHLVMHFAQPWRQVISRALDAKYLLQEYRQTFYDTKGQESQVKIFYPDSWTIHKDDLD